MNALPPAARAYLDVRFAGWRLAEVRASEWMWPEPPMSAAVIWGDFDGDGVLDRAAQIAVGPQAHAAPTTSPPTAERLVFAFLDRGDSTEALLLFRGGTDRDALYVIEAGEETFDSTAAGGRGAWVRTLREAIGVVRGDSAEVYEIETEP